MIEILGIFLVIVFGSLFLYGVQWVILTLLLRRKTTPEQRAVIKKELRKMGKSKEVRGYRWKVCKKHGLLMLEIKATVACGPYWTEMSADGIGGEVRYMGYATSTDKVTNIRL